MKSVFMILNLSKVALVASLSVFITLFLIITVGLFSHAGNVYLLKIAQRVEPRLNIELVQGTFTRKPTFDVISWQDEQTNIHLNNVSYQFKWSCLLSKVCLQNLSIGSGEIMVKTVNQPASKGEPSKPLTRLPIEFIVDNISLNHIKFDVNGTKGVLGQLQLAAKGKKQDIDISGNINNLTVDLLSSTEQQSSVSSNQKKSPLDLTKPLLTKENLPDILVPFNINIKPLTLTNLTINQNNAPLFKLNKLTTETRFNKSLLMVKSFNLDLPETDLQLSGDVNFLKKYPLNLHVKGNLKKITQLQPNTMLANQKFDLKISGDLSNLHSELNLTNKLNIHLSSDVKLMSQYIPYRLDASWQNVRWPLNGDAQYESQRGSLISKGTINDYLINLQSDYLVKGIPSGVIKLQGKGDLQQLDLEKLTVNTLDGDVQLSGLLGWKDAIKWAGDLTLNKIDLAQLESGYSGNISGNIKQNLVLKTTKNQPPSWQFDIPKMDIKGKVLEHAFALNGMITGNNKKGIIFNNVSVMNANNRLTINGSYSKQSDLAVKLDINDLGNAIPQSTGIIKGTVNIQGEIETLNLIANVTGQKLSYQDNKLDSFDLRSKFKLSEIPSIQLALTANDASVNGNMINNIQLDIQNIESKNQSQTHQVQVEINDPHNSVDLAMLIEQNNAGWSSQLTEGRIQLLDYLLTLTKTVIIKPEDNNILVSSHCWDITHSNSPQIAQLCSDDLNIGKQGNAGISLKNFPLASLNEFINEPIALDGELNADATFSWIDLVKPQFDITVGSHQMALNIKKDNNIISYPIDKFDIKLLNTGTTSDFNVLISASKLLTTSMTGQLSENRDEINASLDLSMPDLSPLKDLSTQIEKLAGGLNANIAVNGSIDKPKVNGQINISKATVYAVSSPVKINQLNSNISIKNNYATLDGSFYTEQYNDYTASKTILTNAVNFVDKSVHVVGNVLTNTKTDLPAGNKAIITGNLNWDEKFEGNISLKADKITINDYDKINLQVSPDLHLIFNNAITLTGNVLVDKGLISVNELADSGVAISKDVVIIDKKGGTEAQGLPIIIDLNVDLGNKLQVKAMGLDSIISGNLQVKQPKNGNPSVYGTLSLSDGTYTVLSQQLTLEDSEIIFQGPVATPYISIKAIRDPDNTEDDVTAGVKVTGVPDNLSISIFSDPEMSQQEALSYLIQGQSLSNSSGSDSQLTNMLMILQLSAANSFGILNKVGNKLGIENLSVASSGAGDEQSVGLSGFIAPKVQISYGVGVFDNFAKFAIRYEVFENFFLEASTGLSQAIDAYYQFDID